MHLKPSNRKNKIWKAALICCLPALLIIACNKDDDKGSSENETFISLSVRAVSRSINQDDILWEDRVDELRMLVFNPDNGEVIFNEKLYFPNGFEVQSKAVLLPVGSYNFYFIANETVYTGDFVTALLDIENESDFTTDTRFTTLAYNPAFTPDGTTTEGRFLMSAIYPNIAVTGGGTETNPALLAVPNGRVELIRSLAKVEVIFRKKVSGSSVPENTITSVLLENVATTFSVPPVDNYYTGETTPSNDGSLTGLDYNRDSIGSVSFYIPEFLIPEGNTQSTLLEINNQTFPIENDEAFSGLTAQRRTLPALSTNSVIRNYHYIINAYIDGEGGIVIEIYVKPWQKDTYTYLFQGDKQIVIPPIYPTDSSIIIPTECGKVEILSRNEVLQQGLQGAYNDTVVYYDPVLQGPTIKRGNPPYHCEQKYGEGWRLINSCELMSFLAVCDQAYNIWTSNTWLAQGYNMPYYPLHFRQEAQALMEVLTGYDLSANILYPVNNWEDEIQDTKLDLIDLYFTPGDIMVRIEDYPNGWPFPGEPGTDLTWFYNEATIQVKAYWYGDSYLSPSIRSNWDTILYYEFERYDYSSTVSRCVRTVD